MKVEDTEIVFFDANNMTMADATKIKKKTGTLKVLRTKIKSSESG